MNGYNSESEFEEKIVQINRVSKKTAGGNKIGFSVLVVVGDKQGKVGVGLGKAPAVPDAIRKGVAYAKKHMITVPMVGTTIPHEVYIKRGAAKVLLKPASKGTGVIAGGAVRAVVEAAGIHNILSKVLGTSNQASNVYATMEALVMLAKLSKGKRLVRQEEGSKRPVDSKESEVAARAKPKTKSKTAKSTTSKKTAAKK